MGRSLRGGRKAFPSFRGAARTGRQENMRFGIKKEGARAHTQISLSKLAWKKRVCMCSWEWEKSPSCCCSISHSFSLDKGGHTPSIRPFFPLAEWQGS